MMELVSMGGNVKVLGWNGATKWKGNWVLGLVNFAWWLPLLARCSVFT